MLGVKIALFLLVNCVIISTVKTNQNYTDDNILLFLINSRALYYTNRHKNESWTLIRILSKVGLTNLDYYAHKNMLFLTSPRFGYWQKNSKLYSILWDCKVDCGIEQFEHNFGSPYDKAKVLREEENWNPRSLTVDYIGDKLYIVDTGERSVNVLNLDGTNKATVFEKENVIPMEVQLDHSVALMFILAANIQEEILQIYCASMDGTTMQLIVNNADDWKQFSVREKTGFSLDIVKKRIYFSNFKDERIESVDYEGNKKLVVTKVKYPLSISVNNNTLYWSDSDTNSLLDFVCFDEKCNIWTCKLNNIGVCTENSTEIFLKGSYKNIRAHAIKSIDTRLQIRTSNPCGIDNGGCQHHCLIKPSDILGHLSFGCVCNNGYQLSQNLKNCTRRKVTQVYDDFYLLNATAIRALQHSASTDQIFPLPKNLLARLMYGSSNTVFFQAPFHYFEADAQGEKIYEVRFNPPDTVSTDNRLDFILFRHEITELFNIFELEKFFIVRFFRDKSIANVLTYDWITKNLYYIRLTKGSEEGDLIVLRYEKQDRNSLEPSRFEKPYICGNDLTLTKIDLPVSLVVHPYCGHIFAALYNGSIIRLNSDGSGKLIFPNVNNSILLAVDFNHNKLYWLDANGYISYAHLDGSDQKQICKTYSESADLIYVYDNWIFVKSEENKRIWRFDKISGKDAGTIENDIRNFYHESLGVKVSPRDAQYADKDHPCAINNGGCEVFCFGIPQNKTSHLEKVCACGLHQKLLEDGLKCSKPDKVISYDYFQEYNLKENQW